MQMYPIIGDRYRCKDCKEEIGFDLCGDCYDTKSKLPGRFNQQHTSDHRFEIEKSSTLNNMILSVLGSQFENDTRLQDPDPENEENIFPPWASVIRGDGSRIQVADPENEGIIFPPWVSGVLGDGIRIQDPYPPWVEVVRGNAENAVVGPPTPGLPEDPQDDDTPSTM